MDMQVRHRFAAVRTVVDDDPKSVAQTVLGSHPGRYNQQVAERRAVCGGGGRQARDRLAGHDQQVNGALGCNVVQNDAEFVLPRDAGWDLTGHYLLEQSIFRHVGRSSKIRRPDKEYPSLL
jgi:hypothetical protein